MTEWVLVMMICFRNCEPQYAALFPNKLACESKISDKGSTWSLPKQYCVPLIKGETK